jgi:prepilin-type N-terminal cleavage/methylation domain-containing protein
MLKKFNKRNKGFTIIEVLIVLAIAGLIMLIVFLAVPAVQRNSRNTQRKNDVAGLLGGITEFTNNHNGNLPGLWTFVAGNLSGWDTKPTGGSTNVTVVKLGSYTGTTDVVYTVQPNPTSVTNVSTTGSVNIYTNAKCDTSGNGNAVATGASSRSVVALYTVEAGTGTGSKQCQES